MIAPTTQPQAGNRRRVTKMQQTSQLFTVANLNFNTGLEASSYLLRCPPDQRLPQENFFISAHILKFDYFQNLQRKYGTAKFDYICHSMQARIYQKGDMIFQQGDQAEEFYVVLTGTVSVVVKPKYAELDDLEAPLVAKEVKVLGPGEVFGELALIKGKHGTRAATIYCKETCDIAFFTNTLFNKLLLDKEKDRFDENLNFLYSLEVFKECPEQIIRNAFMYSRVKQYLNNQLVYNQEDMPDFFMIIKRGQFQKQQNMLLEDKKHQVKLCTMSQGEIFGYDELIDETPRKYQVKCVSSFGELFLVAKHDFRSRLYNNAVFRKTLLNLKKQNQLLLEQRIEQTQSFDNLLVNQLFMSNYKKHKAKKFFNPEDMPPPMMPTHKANQSEFLSDETMSILKSMRVDAANNNLKTHNNTQIEESPKKHEDVLGLLPSLSTYAMSPSTSTHVMAKSPSQLSFAEKVVKYKSPEMKQSFHLAQQTSFDTKDYMLNPVSAFEPIERQMVSGTVVNRQLMQPKEIKYYWRMMQKLERYQQVSEIQQQQAKNAPDKLAIYKSFFQFELDFSQKKINQQRYRRDRV